ncbi:hypothetical protein BC826DRAFT_261081 [Russula brevipes]|nr:hypothetical protein BC826DRAFT_261081 [Russula brevipes]
MDASPKISRYVGTSSGCCRLPRTPVGNLHFARFPDPALRPTTQGGRLFPGVGSPKFDFFLHACRMEVMAVIRCPANRAEHNAAEARLEPPTNPHAIERRTTTVNSTTVLPVASTLTSPAELNTTLTNHGWKSLQIRLSQHTTKTTVIHRFSPLQPPMTANQPPHTHAHVRLIKSATVTDLRKRPSTVS